MIKILIFDFWGVVSINDGWPSIARELSKRLRCEEGEIRNKLYNEETQYILGLETTKDFWKRTAPTVPFKDFYDILSLSYQLNEDLLHLLKKLRHHYQILLLSDNIEPTTTTLRQNKNLNEVFSQMYFSNELHMTKRSKTKKIYEYILKELDLRANECAFVDDNTENLSAPKEMGIHTIHYQNFNQFKKELSFLLPPVD